MGLVVGGNQTWELELGWLARSQRHVRFFQQRTEVEMPFAQSKTERLFHLRHLPLVGHGLAARVANPKDVENGVVLTSEHVGAQNVKRYDRKRCRNFREQLFAIP